MRIWTSSNCILTCNYTSVLKYIFYLTIYPRVSLFIHLIISTITNPRSTRWRMRFLLQSKSNSQYKYRSTVQVELIWLNLSASGTALIYHIFLFLRRAIQLIHISVRYMSLLWPWLHSCHKSWARILGLDYKQLFLSFSI